MGFWWIVEDVVYCITRELYIYVTKLQKSRPAYHHNGYSSVRHNHTVPELGIPIHYNLALLSKHFETDVFFLPFRVSSLRRLSKLGSYTALYLTVEVQCVVTVCEVMSDC